MAFSGDLPPLAIAGSIFLVGIEIFSFFLLAIGTHEVLDVVGRVRWRRRTTGPADPHYRPFVSIHVASHNEPPELVLQTLKTLNELDYDNYESSFLTTTPKTRLCGSLCRSTAERSASSSFISQTGPGSSPERLITR